MRTESQRYLDDVVQASAAIGEFCSGKSFAVYTSSILMRSAVKRKVGIVAEALLQLEVVDAETFARIPDARQIASLRDLWAPIRNCRNFNGVNVRFLPSSSCSDLRL